METIYQLNEKHQPHILLSVYINEDGKAEEIELIQEYHGGFFGDYLRTASDEYDEYALKSNDLYDHNLTPNTLYHVYACLDGHGSGEDFEMHLIFLQINKIMENYSKFVEREEAHEEQKRLAFQDQSIEGTICSGSKEYGGIMYKSSITYNDLKNFIGIIAKHNLRLAHRFDQAYNLRQELGDLYDENLHIIETRRLEFKSFLSHNQNLKTEYSEKGYKITNKHYYDIIRYNEVEITFEDIDNIADEVLLQYNSQEILKNFYDTKAIVEELEKFDLEV